jgi:hypothetical protein
MLAVGYAAPGAEKPIIVVRRGTDKKHIRATLKQLLTSRSTPEGRSLRRQSPYVIMLDCDPDTYGIYGVVADHKTAKTTLCYVLIDKIRQEWKCNDKKMLALALQYAIDQPGKLDKLVAVEQELKDVTGLMHKGITGLMERQDNLDSLESQSETLLDYSKRTFENSKKVRKKKCWQAHKYGLIAACVCVGLIILLGGGGFLLWFLGVFGKLLGTFFPDGTITNTTIPI